MAGDEVPTILRRREGVFTPEQMAALGPASSVAVEIRVENRGTPKSWRQERQFTAEDGRRVIDIVANDMASGGDIARAAERRLGVSPPAVT